MLRVTDGRVSTEDSVTVPRGRARTGGQLRDHYIDGIPALTLGLVHERRNSLWLGPFELLRFGPPRVTAHAVEWPIEGGLLTRARGGRFRLDARGGRVVAAVEDYRPRLPLPLYRLTQLPIHHLLIRLHLLRLHGGKPAPGIPAPSRDRMRAAMVDVALCTVLTGVISKRPRASLFLGIAAAYHVTCWSTAGRTLGGLVMRQRVLAIDGRRPTVGQSLVRLLALPFGWARGRPVHDGAAGTTVVED
ncbi:MAG: hypothetical protein PVSMB3_16450 [Candidatus Dormibacteraceae bacterium]